MRSFAHETTTQISPIGQPVARPFAAGAFPAALSAIVLLGALVRLIVLNAQSAWLDEAYSLAVARHSLGFVISFTDQYDFHPPLYYVVLHIWGSLVGFGVTQGRVLSLLCGVAAVPLLYLLGRQLFDRITGLIAATLLAVSPIAAWYSDETRMYAMVFLAVLTAMIVLVCALRSHDGWAWASYVLLAALAFYLDYSAAFVLLGAALYAFVTTRRTERRQVIVSHTALALLIVPVLLIMYEQTRNGAGIAWIPVPTASRVGASLLDLLSQYSAVPGLLSVLGLVLAMFGLFALLRDWSEPRLRHSYTFLASIVLVPLAVALLVSVIHPVFLTRTVLTVLFGILIFIARGPLAVSATRPAARVTTLIPIALLLASNVQGITTARSSVINEDWRATAAFVQTAALPGDLLIFDPYFGQMPFDLYWPGSRNAQRGYPYDESLLRPQPRNLETPAQVARATRGTTTVWVIARAPTLPSDAVTTWLAGHLRSLGSRHFHDITVAGFTRLPVPAGGQALNWLTAAGALLHHVQPGDLVIVRGPGSQTLARAWDTDRHPSATLVRVSAATQGAIGSAVSSQTHTIWLVTTTAGPGDPASIDHNWLYHHGPQSRPMQSFGSVRVYQFAYVWGRR